MRAMNRMIRLVVVATFGLLAGLGAACTTSSSQVGNANLPPDAEINGISATIRDIVYTSTGTQISFQFGRPDNVDAPSGQYYQPVASSDFRYDGFAPVDELDIRMPSTTELLVDQPQFRLGPVLDVNEAVSVQIDRLCPVAQPEAECYEGPWRFEWVPGPEAIDPEATIIRIDETRTTDDLTIYLDEARLSEQELLVTFWSESTSDTEFLFPMLLVRLEDGTELRGTGSGPGTSSYEPRNTLKTLRFFPVPEGTTEFWIGTEPYLREVYRQASFRFSLPPDLDGLDLLATTYTDIEIGVETEVAEQRFLLSHVQVGLGHLNFVVENITEGEQWLNFGVNATLSNTEGRTYEPQGGGLDLQGRSNISFARVNLTALDHLELSTTIMRELVYEPESFHIQIP